MTLSSVFFIVSDYKHFVIIVLIILVCNNNNNDNNNSSSTSTNKQAALVKLGITLVEFIEGKAELVNCYC